MGQALLLAGALGIGAAGAYSALRFKEVSLRSEPRHAPGLLEAERAYQAHLAQDPLTARGATEPFAASGPSGSPPAVASTAPVPAAPLPAAPAPPPSADPPTAVGPAELAYQEQQRLVSEAQAQRLSARAERSRIVEELRALREDAERRRTEHLLQERRALREQAYTEARQSYPKPVWLETTGCVNVAVTGNAGVGKSSFINSVRNLRPRDEGAADVSPNETTMEPTPYDFSNLAVNTRLWDLPGAGTRRFPRDAYVQTMGLRYFDLVIIVTASRYTETEIMIAEELRKFEVPHLMVRNKVDSDITNNEDDHDMPAEETLTSIRSDMQNQGVETPYLISSKFANRERFDMQRLKADACRAITIARDIPEDWLAMSPAAQQAEMLAAVQAQSAQPAPSPSPAPVAAGYVANMPTAAAGAASAPVYAQNVATGVTGGFVV